MAENQPILDIYALNDDIGQNMVTDDKDNDESISSNGSSESNHSNNTTNNTQSQNIVNIEVHSDYESIDDTHVVADSISDNTNYGNVSNANSSKNIDDVNDGINHLFSLTGDE